MRVVRKNSPSDVGAVMSLLWGGRGNKISEGPKTLMTVPPEGFTQKCQEPTGGKSVREKLAAAIGTSGPQPCAESGKTGDAIADIVVLLASHGYKVSLTL